MVKEFGKYYRLMCDNYAIIKKKFSISYRNATGEVMDEDVFHDTLIKCAETLNEDVMSTMSDEALINYTYIAFKNNMYREKKYNRNKCKTDIDIDIDNTVCNIDNTYYWDMRCMIKDFIVKHFGEKTFEECCQWIIDNKSVKDIEKDNDDSNLYYKFKKIKELVIKKFGNDLYDIEHI